MKINIKTIEFFQDESKKIFYDFTKKKNTIIKGPSGEGKTPLMLLLFFALGGNRYRKVYFEHRSETESNSQHWNDETIVVNYTMEHNGIFLNVIAKVKSIIKEEKMESSLEINGFNHFENNRDTGAISYKLLEILELPTQILWKDTLTKRSMNDFIPFYGVISNLNQKNGYLYDSGIFYQANNNTFISAFILLKNLSKDVELLWKIDKIKSLDKINKKKKVLRDVVSSLCLSEKYTATSENPLSSIKWLVKEEENILEEIQKIKSENRKYTSWLKQEKISVEMISLIKKYNQTYMKEKIDIEFMKSLINTNNKSVSKALPSINHLISINKNKIEKLKKELSVIENNISSAGLMNSEILSKELIKKVLKETLEKIGNSNNEINGQVANDGDDEFKEILRDWMNTYFINRDELSQKIKNTKIIPPQDWLSIFRFKYSTGGESSQKYIKVFSTLNKIINTQYNCELPFLVDSLFEIKSDPNSKNTLNKILNHGEKIREILDSNKNQIILTMTDEDFQKLSEKERQEFQIYNSPFMKRNDLSKS